MSTVTTGPVRVELVEVATGTHVSRWPVDARELLATGDYVRAEDYVAPEEDGAGEPTDPDAGGETGTEGDETTTSNRRRR